VKGVDTLNTILFDLDGTLLPMDMSVFEREYFKRLCKKLENYFPPDKTIDYVWNATYEMISNTDPNLANIDVFMDKFCKLSNRDREEMLDVFSHFYDNEYKELKEFFSPSFYMVKAVRILKNKGYILAVATNPIFPMKAVLERIKWAGLNQDDFHFITSFENMHFCKPHIDFYKEVLWMLGKKPEDCLMVGNDVEEDLIARRLGIKTFLIKDYAINKNNISVISDFIGSYEDFYNFVQTLPTLKG